MSSSIKRNRPVSARLGLSVLALFFGGGFLAAQSAAAANPDARDDASPWGMGSSAEWSGEYPRFDPLLARAGVRWIRLWSEWQSVEPREGQFNWDATDKIVADAQANHLRILPTWAYFAPWASADGGTRRGPIKDLKFWRDYVAASVTRYAKDLEYWEVWNEFNGSFYQGINKPREYAELVVAASEAAKKADPTAKIGLSVANFDAGFLDAAIKAGAADHFDFICVHPYENLGALATGGEVGYLSLADNLRAMLKANHQPADLPLWITEVGFPAPIKADPVADAKQAEILAKGELLSIAQGFQRIFWFEARGPSYGHGTDLGIIRQDWTPRPAYAALSTLTTLLGPEPKYLGWLNVDQGAYGFLFQGAKGQVLAAWAPPGKAHAAKFAAEVKVTSLNGTETTLKPSQGLPLTSTPVFITQLPAALAAQAQSNLGKAYPWGGDYAHARAVTCGLGAVNREDGLKQINPHTTVVVNGLAETCVRPDFSNPALHNEGRYIYFRVDPQFVPYSTKHLEVTIVARRLATDKPANLSLTYESAAHGYTGAGKGQELPADENWHELTWDLTDVNFVGQWGWNFRFEAIGSPNEFYVKEVRVNKPAAK